MSTLIIDGDSFSLGIDRRTFNKGYLNKGLVAAWDMYNFDLDQYGRLLKRDGYTRFNATQLAASTTIPSIFCYYNLVTNTREIIAVLSDNTLVRVTDSGVGGTPTSAVTTTTRDLQYAVLRGFMAHTLGTQYLRFFYPNVTRDSGVAPPTFTPTLTAAAGGSLKTSSWYRYRFTYAITTLSSNTLPVAMESTPRSNTKTSTTFDVQLTGANNQVNIASLAASADVNVDITRIYRSNGQPTQADLDTVECYFVAQQNDATTTYTDTIADTSLGGLLDTYDHDRLGTDVLTSTNRLRAITVFKDRFWVSKDIDNAVVSSKRLSQTGYLGLVGDPIPSAFPEENIFTVGASDGDTITAMTVLNGELLIFKRYSIWVLSGADDPNNPPQFSLRRIANDLGCYADRSLANTGNQVVFLSHRGVYAFDGVKLDFIGDGLQPIISGATQTNQMEAFGIFVDRKNEYWLAINDAEDLSATPGGYTTATRDRIFIWDFYRRYWRSAVLPSTISSLGVLIPQTTAQTPLVLAGSDNESFIYRLLNGTTDAVAGVATETTSRWQSDYLGIGDDSRGGLILTDHLRRKKVKRIYTKANLTSDTNRRPRFSVLAEGENASVSNTVTITPSSRVDISSYNGGMVHVARDLRLRITMDTRASEAANTDAALESVAVDFDMFGLR